MIAPKQIEAIETEAWQNMFDAAPDTFKQQMNLYYVNIGGGTCLVFPKYPVVHFNMVMGLGLTEPISMTIQEQVEAVYKKENQTTFMIHYFDGMQPSNAPEVFESMGYKIKGGWERITWKNQPLIPLLNKRNILVKTVDSNTVAAWEKFVLDIYRYPARGWLQSLYQAEGWIHFLAFENNRIISCRSMYLGANGMAWTGIDTPVPIVMTNDLEPDKVLFQHMQQYCIDHGVEYLVADIEAPSPGRNTIIYNYFKELGFRVEYLRKLYRK